MDYDNGSSSVFWKVSIAIVLIGLALSGTYALGWVGETARVAQQELGAEAALKKYEWFKDAAAQLDKKRADIPILEGRMKAMEQTYKDLPRQNWPREDREQSNVWASEVAGAKAGYNQLAAEYNAAMAKANWRFANAGELPKGADKPLPREYAEYMDK